MDHLIALVVLAALRFAALAFGAKPKHFHRHALYLEPCGKFAALHGQPKTFFIQIRNRPAVAANQMMVRGAVRFHAQRTVMQADLSYNSALHKKMQVLVHRRQGNGRDATAYTSVDLFGRWMAFHFLYHFEQNLTLMRRRQTMLSTEGSKLLRSSHSIEAIR